MLPAIFTNINPTEMMLIAVVAILIYGRRLPEVAGRAAGYVQRARRALNDIKRESGLDEELRTARRAMDDVLHPSELRDLPKLESPARTVGRGTAGPTQAPLPDEASDAADEPDPSGASSDVPPKGDQTTSS